MRCSLFWDRGRKTLGGPRTLEIKGSVAELSQRHQQRMKGYQVRVVPEEIEAIVPKEARVCIGWAGIKHKTTKDRGRVKQWSVSGFQHCTGMMMMMMVSRMVKHDCRVNGETVRASLQLSCQRRPLGKAQTMFSPPSSKPKGTRQRSIQISCFAVVGLAVKIGCQEKMAGMFILRFCLKLEQNWNRRFFF